MPTYTAILRIDAHYLNDGRFMEIEYSPPCKFTNRSYYNRVIDCIFQETLTKLGCWTDQIKTPNIKIDIEATPISEGHTTRIWTITFDFTIDNKINDDYPNYFLIPTGSGILGKLCTKIITIDKLYETIV